MRIARGRKSKADKSQLATFHFFDPINTPASKPQTLKTRGKFNDLSKDKYREDGFAGFGRGYCLVYDDDHERGRANAG